jgi:hypothetical protein
MDHESKWGRFSSGYEKAIMVLFKPQTISFLRNLRQKMDEDPQYINAHEESIRPQVHQVLNDGGVIWDQKILDNEWKKIVLEAVIHLRSVEKGATPSHSVGIGDPSSRV